MNKFQNPQNYPYFTFSSSQQSLNTEWWTQLTVSQLRTNTPNGCHTAVLLLQEWHPNFNGIKYSNKSQKGLSISAFTFRFSKKLFFRTWCTPQMQLSIKPNRSTYTHNGKYFTIYCEFGELFSGGNPHPILFVSPSLTGIQSGFAPILFIHFMVFIHGTASTRQMKKKNPPRTKQTFSP